MFYDTFFLISALSLATSQPVQNNKPIEINKSVSVVVAKLPSSNGKTNNLPNIIPKLTNNIDLKDASLNPKPISNQLLASNDVNWAVKYLANDPNWAVQYRANDPNWAVKDLNKDVFWNVPKQDLNVFWATKQNKLPINVNPEGPY